MNDGYVSIDILNLYLHLSQGWPDRFPLRYIDLRLEYTLTTYLRYGQLYIYVDRLDQGIPFSAVAVSPAIHCG